MREKDHSDLGTTLPTAQTEISEDAQNRDGLGNQENRRRDPGIGQMAIKVTDTTDRPRPPIRESDSFSFSTAQANTTMTTG